jgi:predicted ATP-dependent endonuclease of OLD family
MDLVVRSVISKKDEIKKFEEKTEKEYQETYDPTKLKELSTLQERLTATLKIYVPNANINLTWRPLSKINIPLPQADIKLIEDDYPVPVSKTGHGLQRAFILTLLQHLSLAQISTKKGDAESKGEAEEASLPNLVLAIEEPELYQHPSRQRHFSNVLLQLATGKIPGVAEKTQILYTTHSPLFVGIDRINQIRLFRKIPYEKDKPKVTKVVSTNLDVIAEKIWEANGKQGEKYTGDSLIPRLVTIMNPWMNEGFFSDAVVLVEGEDDRAALIGTASYMGYDLERLGYSVIPCSGKTNIDRPATIFRELNIPVYLLWDGDKGDGKAKPEDNHRLLRLLGQPISDWPCAIEYTYSCFEKNLEETLKDEIGEALFERCLLDCQNEYNITEKKHALKNPHVITGIIKRASEQDKPSVVLKNIIEKILFLKCPLNQFILSS